VILMSNGIRNKTDNVDIICKQVDNQFPNIFPYESIERMIHMFERDRDLPRV
jgi:hypothetical protein